MPETENEFAIRIVYWGPGLSGKTTNLLSIHTRTPSELRSEMSAIATETERLLSFSMVPTWLPPRRGRAVRVEFATVPGSVFYAASRRKILRDVDGIVVVIDTQPARLEAARESIRDLAVTLRETTGRGLGTVPLVAQYNKRDFPSALSRAALDSAIVPCLPRDTPVVEAIATRGVGVLETLDACLRRVLASSA